MQRIRLHSTWTWLLLVPLIRNVRARFYDMAAETSGDAKVPVALALAKLAVVFAWKNAEELKLIIGKLLYYQS